MVRQGSPERSRRTRHERNQYGAVHPELIEGLNQRSLESPIFGLRGRNDFSRDE